MDVHCCDIASNLLVNLIPMRYASIHWMLSRPSAQWALQQTLKLCHCGLNYGWGQEVDKSGEFGVLVRLRDRSSGPLNIFDVGANKGAYLGAVLTVLGSRANVWSFEPQSSVFEKLQSRYGQKPNVELICSALGSGPGRAEIYHNSQTDTMASLYASAGSHSEMIDVSTVDEICAKRAVDRIDLLKIDTEGFELNVLRGAESMLARNAVRAIQFEFGDAYVETTVHFKDFWSLLSPKYRIYRILRHGLTEIRSYSTDLEIYKTANFFCELR